MSVIGQLVSSSTYIYIAVPDKVEHSVRQGGCIIDAGSRSGFRHAAADHRQPSGTGRRLLLEFALEGLLDVADCERADGRAHETSGRRREHAVEAAVVTRNFVDAL